jgi:pimeloyl-ACP methyl ester carboxylesterase
VPRVRVNGVDTSYEQYGSGVPALFIHGGYGGAATTLVPQPTIIQDILPQDRVQTITYDRRGAGRSEYVSGPYSVADLAADARALLDHLGHQRAIIIGSSAGGPIAIQYALAYPDTVLALALPNTGPNLSSPERAVGQERRRLVQQARAEGPGAVFAREKDRLRQAPTPGATPTPEAARNAEQRRQRVQAALKEATDEELSRFFAGELANYAAYLDFDFTNRLGELRMPVCIIHGDADAVVPLAWGEALHGGIPGSELHVIPGGGHGILQWPAGAAALREWVLRVIAGA